MLRVVGMIAALLCALATEANAVDRNCPRGQVWDPNQGSCAKKRRGKRASPEKKYQAALGHLEGTRPKADPKKGASLLREACRAKHSYSCTQLGFLHLTGRAVDKDAKKSLEYYEHGCELKDAFGCLGAADVLARGVLGDADHARAIPHLQTACALDNGRGCYALGEKYLRALGTDRDELKAGQLFKEAYELLSADCPGSATSCHLLGKSHQLGRGADKSPVRAVEAFSKGCKGGSGDACLELGVAYQLGLGTGVDEARAMDLYDKACTTYDNASACHHAGSLMADWQESARDDDRLESLAKRACELDARRCDVLAHLYATGKAVAKNESKAGNLYRKACDSGSGVACFAAGYRSMEGIGLPKNAIQAIALYRRSCELEHVPGCDFLGREYYSGKHLDRDRGKALELHELACLRDHPVSCHLAAQQLESGRDGTGEPRHDRAALFYQAACRLGRGWDCVKLGDLAEADAAKRQEHYQRACALDHAQGCVALGNMHYRGEGVEKNTLTAAKSYREACIKGAALPCRWLDPIYGEAKVSDVEKAAAVADLDTACKKANETGCVVLGSLYAYGGALVTKDGRKAVAVLEASCKRKHPEACVQLAQLYSAGIGVVKDPDKAKALLTEQCDGGAPNACSALAFTLWFDKEHKRAVPLFSRACKEGDGRACNMMGFAHYTAQGARWDVKKAVSGYERGCELDEPVACANVGELYEHGIGVDRNVEKALAYYEKGCTPATTAGCAPVGRFYLTGKSVKVDLLRAERELARSCKDEFSSSAEACRDLAAVRRKSGADASDVAALTELALSLAREWAETNPYGKYVLGRMHLDGVTTVKDPKRATELFVAACEGYDPLGCMRAGDLLAEAKDKQGAAARYARACAARIQEGCARAEAMRTGKKPVTKATVAPVTKSPRGCGCTTSSPSPAGSIAMLIALIAVRRRRIARPSS